MILLFVNLRLKEMYTWIMQKKYEILMEAKKRFKFYTTTVMRVEMKYSYQYKGHWKFYIVWMKKQCSLKYN